MVAEAEAPDARLADRQVPEFARAVQRSSDAGAAESRMSTDRAGAGRSGSDADVRVVPHVETAHP